MAEVLAKVEKYINGEEALLSKRENSSPQKEKSRGEKKKERSPRRRDVTPRFPVRPDWRIRTGFRARDYILGLFTYIFFITESKYYIHIQKNYHRSGVHQNLYIYTESHLHIQNCTFTFTNQSAEPTCSEPLLVCWPNSMRKFMTSSPVPTQIKNPC